MGKQVGTSFVYAINEEKHWSSVGIQKWEGSIKVYVDEIAESQMVAENFIREETRKFITVKEALVFVEQNTRAELKDLAPCKGQKVFNPKFDYED